MSPSRTTTILLAMCALAPLAAARANDAPVLGATIGASCAPWDGAAFVVEMPVDSLGRDLTGARLAISVWKAPRIPAGTMFTFHGIADSGAVVLWSGKDSAQRLTGTVTFGAVGPDAPADGSFDLSTKGGRRLAARFHATWKKERVMCG